jgi:hypothetical protein
VPPVPAPPRGPYVQAALICEKILQEADGVATLVRVIDRLFVTASGPEPPLEMPPQQPQLFAIVMLKSGETTGRHSLKFRPEAPGGEQRPALEVQLNFEGNERGNNVNIDLQGLTLDREGLWWFDVLFGDNETLMTRIPLRLIYQPQQVQVTTQPPESP